MISELKEKNIKPVAGWDDGKNIYFVYRDENKEKKIWTITDFEWYFCLKKKDYVNNLKKIRSIHSRSTIIPNEAGEWKVKGAPVITKVVNVGDFVKIYCDKSNQNCSRFLNNIKKGGFNTREADLSLLKRYMIDYQVDIEEDLSFLFFDIETDDSVSGIVIGRSQIISWAACDSNGKKFFDKAKTISRVSETNLLKNLLKLFMKYDMIVGWNSNQFDIAYIQDRLNQLNITGKGLDEPDLPINQTNFWKKIIHIDLMQRLIKLFGPMMSVVNLTGFSLDEVAKVFIGQQKVQRKEKVIDLFKNYPEELKKYNLRDVKLLYKINEKLRTIPLMIKECVWTGTFLNRFYIGELLDNYILREANQENFHLKTRPGYEENPESLRIRGGYVMEPKTGLYENVRTLDFKSMYPSIIVGWNIGQESLVEGKISEIAQKDFSHWIKERKIDDISFMEWYKFLKAEDKKLNPDNKYFQTANNQYFKKEKPSIIASLVKRLLQERKAYKKQQLDSTYNSIEYKNAQAAQEAVKEMSNSMYGITADKQARYFDPRIAEAITMTGQFMNRTTMHLLEKMGYPVFYGDTDSIFLIVDDDKEMEELIINLNKRLSEHLLKTYKFAENIILIEYEKKFRKFIMLDKKRYAGHLIMIDNKPVDSILSKGTENVRKSTIEFTRRKVDECLDLLVKQDKDEKFMKKWIRDLKEYVMNENIPGSELAITMKLSKPTSSYKSKPPHVKLAEKLIETKEILETHEGKHVWGQKIEYIIVDNKDKDNKAILLRDFDGTWDRKYYWDTQIYAPLMRILKIVWPESNWEEHNILLFEKAQKKLEQIEQKKEREEEKQKKKTEKENKQKSKKFTQLNLF